MVSDWIEYELKIVRSPGVKRQRRHFPEVYRRAGDILGVRAAANHQVDPPYPTRMEATGDVAPSGGWLPMPEKQKVNVLYNSRLLEDLIRSRRALSGSGSGSHQ